MAPNELAVSSLSSRFDAGVLDGAATLKSSSGALKLAVAFHVGARAWLELEDGGVR